MNNFTKEWELAVSASDRGDKATALSTFKILASKGVQEALLEIGVLYEFGGDDIDIDYVEAFSWYQRSAEETSSPHAYLALARCYFHGQGIERNQKTAIDIYKSVILEGNPVALLVLGRAYQFGIGVDLNIETAEKYLNHSAAKGNVFAKRDLGLIYSNQGKKLIGFFWKLRAIFRGIYLSYTTNEHDFRIREF